VTNSETGRRKLLRYPECVLHPQDGHSSLVLGKLAHGVGYGRRFPHGSGSKSPWPAVTARAIPFTAFLIVTSIVEALDIANSVAVSATETPVSDL
jgi:hypothetical protein